MQKLKIAVSRICPDCVNTQREVVSIMDTDFIDVAAAVVALADIDNGIIDKIEQTGFGLPIFIATHNNERVPEHWLARINGVFEISESRSEFYTKPA